MVGFIPGRGLHSRHVARFSKRVCAAVSVLLVGAGASTASSEPQQVTANAGCNRWIDALVVVAVCNGRLGGDFEIAGGTDRGFATGPEPGLARLRGRSLRTGDRIVLSGAASEKTVVVAVLVTSSGRARDVLFDDLGLEHGGRVTLTVRGQGGATTVVLRRPDGKVVSAAGGGIETQRRYVGDLVVHANADRVDVRFTAPSTLAEVGLLDAPAVDELLKGGELEDPFLAVTTVATRTGKTAFVRLPMRSRGAFVYVKPLARNQIVMPAIGRVR